MTHRPHRWVLHVFILLSCWRATSASHRGVPGFSGTNGRNLAQGVRDLEKDDRKRRSESNGLGQRRRRLPPHKKSGGGGGGGGGGGSGYHGCLGKSSYQLNSSWIFPGEAPPCQYVQHYWGCKIYYNGQYTWGSYEQCQTGNVYPYPTGGGDVDPTYNGNDGSNGGGQYVQDGSNRGNSTSEQGEGEYSAQGDNGEGGGNGENGNDNADGEHYAAEEDNSDQGENGNEQQNGDDGEVQYMEQEQDSEVVTNEDFEDEDGEDGDYAEEGNDQGQDGNGNDGGNNDGGNQENGNDNNNGNQNDGNGQNDNNGNNGNQEEGNNGNGQNDNNGQNNDNGNGGNNNAEESNENNAEANGLDPYEGFFIKECDTYENLWLWDLSLTCESPEESLEACECPFAQELMDLGVLSCNDIVDCPRDCQICETCLRILGCTNSSVSPFVASNGYLYIVVAAVGLLAFAVAYYVYARHRRRRDDDLGENLVAPGPGSQPSSFGWLGGGAETPMWLAPDTAPAQFEPSNRAALESSEGESYSDFSSLEGGGMGRRPSSLGAENAVWLAPVT